MEMEKECSGISEYKIQTPENHPKERTQLYNTAKVGNQYVNMILESKVVKIGSR
jgi:hypothetical protein